MMTVCLTVLSIVGSHCFNEAQPIGDCIYSQGTAYCTVASDELPVRPSWYDPALGDINCQEPCDYLGDGTLVASSYGQYIACPLGWYGRWIEVEHMGKRQCRDHGGDIVPKYGRTYSSEHGFVESWWITIDVLEKKQPFYAYDLLDWQFAES